MRCIRQRCHLPVSPPSRRPVQVLLAQPTLLIDGSPPLPPSLLGNARLTRAQHAGGSSTSLNPGLGMGGGGGRRKSRGAGSEDESSGDDGGMEDEEEEEGEGGERGRVKREEAEEEGGRKQEEEEAGGDGGEGGDGEGEGADWTLGVSAGRGKRTNKARLVYVDGHPVLKENLYDLQSGEPSVFAKELAKGEREGSKRERGSKRVIALRVVSLAFSPKS